MQARHDICERFIICILSVSAWSLNWLWGKHPSPRVSWALQIKALRVSHGTGFRTGWTLVARVTLYRICSHFIVALQNYSLLIKESLSYACWYFALLHWPFRATHYSHILKVDALKRLTVVEAGRANEQLIIFSESTWKLIYSSTSKESGATLIYSLCFGPNNHRWVVTCVGCAVCLWLCKHWLRKMDAIKAHSRKISQLMRKAVFF